MENGTATKSAPGRGNSNPSPKGLGMGRNSVCVRDWREGSAARAGRLGSQRHRAGGWGGQLPVSLNKAGSRERILSKRVCLLHNLINCFKILLCLVHDEAGTSEAERLVGRLLHWSRQFATVAARASSDRWGTVHASQIYLGS